MTVQNANTTLNALDTKSASERLENEGRIISFAFIDQNGKILLANGELQTLVELLIQQTAPIADRMGSLLEDGPARFFSIHSNHYSAYFARAGKIRLGAITEKSLSAEEFKSLVS